jgi:DNA-binding XRE family transcriptional regulator
MDKFTLEQLSGRPVNIKALAKAVGVSRQTIYDSFNRGYFPPKLARAIADELRIHDGAKRAQLVGMG